jgi:hypothetical protein
MHINSITVILSDFKSKVYDIKSITQEFYIIIHHNLRVNFPENYKFIKFLGIFHQIYTLTFYKTIVCTIFTINMVGNHFTNQKHAIFKQKNSFSSSLLGKSVVKKLSVRSISHFQYILSTCYTLYTQRMITERENFF